MLKTIALCLASLLLLILLKQSRAEYAFLLKIAVLLLILLSLYGGISTAANSFSALWQAVGTDNALLKVMLKALGLALTAQIASDLCKDSGENALSSAVELTGKLGIVLMAMPLATELVEICLGWLQ